MLDGTLSTSPTRLTTIVVSMFVNNTLRAHSEDNLVSCADVICDFGPRLAEEQFL